MTRSPKRARVAVPAAATQSTPPRPAPEPHIRFALIGIFVATLMRLLWLAGQPIDLYPDEAQYWIWAQHLAWGYFSKPPIVAWIIRATTEAFGEGVLAIKAGAPILYVFTAITVFLTGARLYDKRVAAWATIAFITLPAVSISSVIISTDVPLLLFWALATYGLVRAREEGGERWWLLVGIAGGLGLLSKYAMGFWLASALVFLIAFRDERRHLRPYLTALVMALVIYSPNLLWNWQHGFASYVHTEANANVHGFAFHPWQLAEFALSQFGVFGPIFLATLILIALRWREAVADRRTALLLMLALPTLLIMIVEASLSRAQPNWSAPTYITATILVVAWLSQRGREGLVQWSVVLHVALAVVVLGAREFAQGIHHPLPAEWDPLHRVEGWQTLGRSVSEARASHFGLPLLVDERELAAELTYYMQPHPFDLLMWNPGGGARNYFEMERSLPGGAGGDFLWVTARKDRDEIFTRFDSHEEVSHILVLVDPGKAQGKPPMFREVWVYVLHGFKGYAAH